MTLKYFIVRDNKIIGLRFEDNGVLKDAYLSSFDDVSELDALNLGYLRGIKSYTDDLITPEELLSGTKLECVSDKEELLKSVKVFERPSTHTEITLDFEREVELSMFDWYYNRPNQILYVKGARQTGKTYTIKKFIKRVWGSLNIEDGVYLINLTDEVIHQKLIEYRSESRPYNQNKLGIESFVEYLFPDFDANKAKVLYIDEIQEDAGLYNCIREFARDRSCRLIVSGSYLNIVSEAKLGNNVFKPPMGGDYLVTMRSLSFVEFLQANGVINSQVLFKSVSEYTEEDNALFDEVQRLYSVYLQIGGYPEVVKEYIRTKSIDSARVLLSDLIRNYFEESKPYLAMCKPTVDFEDTFESILSVVTDTNKRFKTKDLPVEIRDKMLRSKGSISTDDVCHTLDWLESGGFIRKVRKYVDFKDLSNYTTGQRYYFYDLGVVNYIASRSAIPETTLNGYLAENFAFLQISETGYIASDTLGYAYIVGDKEMGNAELDFVYRDTNKECFVGVEVKYTNSGAKTLQKVRSLGVLKHTIKVINEKTVIESGSIPIFLLRFYCLFSDISF